MSVYFDQKFILIPLICFLNIFFGSFSRYTKILTISFYIFFAIPYLFLIKIWGGIFPTNIYQIGSQFYFHHLGFALTIIAFIFFPFLIFEMNNIEDKIKKFFINKKFLLYANIFIYFPNFFYENSFLNDN